MGASACAATWRGVRRRTLLGSRSRRSWGYRAFCKASQEEQSKKTSAAGFNRHATAPTPGDHSFTHLETTDLQMHPQGCRFAACHSQRAIVTKELSCRNCLVNHKQRSRSEQPTGRPHPMDKTRRPPLTSSVELFPNLHYSWRILNEAYIPLCWRLERHFLAASAVQRAR